MVRTPRLQLGNAVGTRRYGGRRSSYRFGEGRIEATPKPVKIFSLSKRPLLSEDAPAITGDSRKSAPSILLGSCDRHAPPNLPVALPVRLLVHDRSIVRRWLHVARFIYGP